MALLGHAVGGDDDDPVGVADRGEAVGDDQRRAALRQLRERALDRLLGLGV
jgi:hypothetical protein